MVSIMVILYITVAALWATYSVMATKAVYPNIAKVPLAIVDWLLNFGLCPVGIILAMMSHSALIKCLLSIERNKEDKENIENYMNETMKDAEKNDDYCKNTPYPPCK